MKYTDEPMTSRDVTVTFLPSGRKTAVPLGTNLMKAAIAANVEIESVCGGKGACGKCLGRLVKGSISEFTAAEERHLPPEALSEGRILLCQRKLLGDAIIEVEKACSGLIGFSPDKGEPMHVPMELNPQVVKTHHELAVPTIHDQTSDLDRVSAQLAEGTEAGPDVVAALPRILRDNHFSVTSVVLGDRLIAVEGGDTSKETYGIALDIGTTTVAGYLVDLAEGGVLYSAAAPNGQGAFGADVLSRVSYTLKEPGGLSEMKRLVGRTIDGIVSDLLDSSGIRADHIYLLTVVGNTVMSHLLLGVPAGAIAVAPFVPAFSRIAVSRVDALDLQTLSPRTHFSLLPNIGGYVGSDTTGVILATGIHALPGTWMAIDIGTNGEIVLASDGRLLACSTAAGPAFEGGSISQGMRAEPGAISQVALDEDVHLSVIGQIEARGICGSGLIDAVSEMVRLGIVQEGGRLRRPEDCIAELPPVIRGRIRQAQNGHQFFLTEGGRHVAITQKDISELQLAKGAMRAGIEILLEEVGATPEDLDGFLLAGAFGSRLRPESLRGIGLIPEMPLDRVQAVGNAAGTGAIMALLSGPQLKIASEIATRVEHRDLTTHKAFSHKFARAMRFDQVRAA